MLVLHQAIQLLFYSLHLVSLYLSLFITCNIGSWLGIPNYAPIITTLFQTSVLQQNLQRKMKKVAVQLNQSRALL